MLKTLCDKCKNDIVEIPCKLILENKAEYSGNELKVFDLCDNCYLTLKAKLKEYLPE